MASSSVARRPRAGLAAGETGVDAPLRTQLYVVVVALLAAAIATLAVTHVAGTGGVAPGYVVMFAVLIALGECLQLRYLHRDQIGALTLVEGMFAPLIFCGSGSDLVIAVGSGLVLACVYLRRTLVMTVFTISQRVAAGSVGILAFHASGLTRGSSAADALALIGAMLAVWSVSQLLVAGIRYSTSGHVLGSADDGVMWLAIVDGWASFAGSAILGLLMTGAFVWVPWVSALAVGPLVLLWSAGHSQASLRADRRLLDTLQRVTHHLATSLDPTVALPTSLAQARDGFEVREVQLVVVAEHGFPTTYRCTDGEDGFSVETGPHGLAELLVDSLIAPTRLGTDGLEVSSMLDRMGHLRGLAAPLRSNGTTFGVVILLGRDGPDGFEAGELSAAGGLARELVGFLERAELVGAIEDQRGKLDDIVQNTSDGILSLDTDATILSWNEAMAALTGYSAQEMIGTRHFGLLRPRDTHDVDLQIISWADRFVAAGLPGDLQIVTVDGATLWLSCTFNQVVAVDDGPDSLVVIARDITKQRELEVLKDDFMAVVSHELRTPLVPIKGWAQTLLTRGDRLSEDQRRTAIQSILTQAQRLEALVLNILESSRVEAGQAEALDVVDVAAVAVHVAEDVLAARPDQVIRVQPPQVPCHVRGSSVWVDRALANLVANAVKYSPDDSPVDVVVSGDDGTVVVSVTDRGPGISVEAQERIFERFERLEESRQQAGTGLGLYITRRLARAMGGDVSVSSLPGAGSTFVLTLPALASSTFAAVPEQISPPGAEADPPNSVVNLH